MGIFRDIYVNSSCIMFTQYSQSPVEYQEKAMQIHQKLTVKEALFKVQTAVTQIL